MANTTTMLLTAEERRALYACPTLDDRERNEYFTFNEAEIKTLKSFKQGHLMKNHFDRLF